MIDQAKAIEIAKERAAQNQWAFIEPVTAILRKNWRGKPTRIEIETNTTAKGAKARFVIDINSGKILSEGYIPR